MSDVVTIDAGERRRRWALALGGDAAKGLDRSDVRMSAALDALYGDDGGGRKTAGSLGRSAPKAASWLGDIREFFPESVVALVQKDAFERLGMKELLYEPEFLETVAPDASLVAELVALRGGIPEKARETARIVVRKVVEALMAKLAKRTEEHVRGAVDRSRRTTRPRLQDVDWNRTIPRNMRNWQPEYGTLVVETLVGRPRKAATRTELDEVILCVDQSGSMGTSVVYSSVFAAVMASLPVVKTKLVFFDTAIVDMTDELDDPVDVIFGVQLGGGTDIHGAVRYCADRIEQPAKAHFVLITDLYENYADPGAFVDRLAKMKAGGTNVVVLLALTDEGRPSYDPRMAARIAAKDIPVFACTPDLFPDMMGACLRREDVGAWATREGIRVTAGTDGDGGIS